MRDKNNLFFKGENMSISSKLAEYAIKAFQQEIPEPVVKMAIQAIIDQYGLQIGGSEFPWSKAIYKTEKVYNKSSGSSTITRYGDELSQLKPPLLIALLRMLKILMTAIKKLKLIQEVWLYPLPLRLEKS